MSATRWGRMAALGAVLLGGSTAASAAVIDLASGVTAGVGIASDPVQNDVYFVEFNGGTLKRIHIDPGCDATSPATCTITTVASGFVHPEDVALDLDHGLAYVTTRDDPGTTGALWRVDLATGVRSLVTFNLGAPHQIVLDIPTNGAYVVGFDSGRLWRVDLTTGAKVSLASGLGHPVGLAITADRARAYVTVQNPPGRILELDLALGTTLRTVATGLTAPFYLAWTDPAQFALYVAERAPANRLTRVDVTTGTSIAVATGLPSQPSGVAVNLFAGAAYVAADSKVVEVTLADIPPAEPVFIGVGHVPATKITDGYATTDPGYFFQVKDAPFGGTLNILGNLSNFKSLGATHYRVLVSYDGAPFAPLALGWNAYRWSTATSQYELTPVAPIPGDDRYEIPAEYPLQAARWLPSFLMMSWPSGDNGLYTFTVQIFRLTGTTWTDLTPLLTSGNSLTVRVDNTGLTTGVSVDVTGIRQHTAAGTAPVIGACTIIEVPSHGTNHTFDVRVTARDANQHLASYTVTALWGHNGSATLFSDSYASHVDEEGPNLWSGVSNRWVPPAGWTALCNCAHTFYLDAWKRTIDGYQPLFHASAHQSVTINNAGATCAP